MTLAELLEYLDSNLSYPILDGDAQATLSKSLAGTHREPVVGEMVRAISEGNHCTDASCVLERAQVVLAVGPTRLKYMADDAPAEGLRIVEGMIRTIDAAYNHEALRQKQNT